VTDSAPRNRRPVLAADVERLSAGAGVGDPFARLELAHATAAAVVDAGRRDGDPATESMVRLADRVGLDTLAELWREAPSDTLPGVLWSLYLLRTWCAEQAAEVSRMYRAGRGLAPVEEVVAGVRDDGDPAAVLTLADTVLTGAYDGDFAGALERAAAFFRIVATGREDLAPEPPAGADERRRAARNRDVAEALARAAAAWRAGRLR